MRITPVQGYKGYYWVTDEGDILSVKTGGPLSQTVPKDGYHRVHLYNGKVRKGFQVHRLVALHFCEGYKEGLVVNHKDGDTHNNNYWNLEWTTQKGNVANCIERGTHNVRSAQEAAKIKNKVPVVAISPTGEESEYPSAKEAGAQLGLSPSKITDVLKYRRKHTKGYTSRYK